MEKQRTLLTTLQYSINVDEYDEAFVEIQKRYVYPRNIIYTVVVALVAAYNIYLLINNPNNNVCWMVVAVSLAFIFTLWYNPIKRRKSLREALSQLEDDNYITEVFDDSIKITTVPKVNEETGEAEQIAPKIIFYETDEIHAVEKSSMFIVYIKKQMYYVIPKKFLSEEQIKTLSSELEEKARKFFPMTK